MTERSVTVRVRKGSALSRLLEGQPSATEALHEAAARWEVMEEAERRKAGRRAG